MDVGKPQEILDKLISSQQINSEELWPSDKIMRDAIIEYCGDQIFNKDCLPDVLTIAMIVSRRMGKSL